MCLCCLCSYCCGVFKFTHVAAIVTAVEAGLWVWLNLSLILLYTCDIPPSEDGGVEFVENIRSWFFYDEDNCQDKDSGYIAPDWIVPIPESFDSSTAADRVTAKKNESYQITYMVFHALWLLSSIVLIYGNARRKWRYYLPWIFIAVFLASFDIAIGSIYIKLMDDVNLDWDEGSAIFWMIMLYFRGFALLVMNIILIFNVCQACSKSYKKENKKLDGNEGRAAQVQVTTTVRNEVPLVIQVQTHHPSPVQPPRAQNYSQGHYPPLPMMETAPPYSPSAPPNPSGAAYYNPSPFSYTNTGYPSDPNEMDALEDQRNDRLIKGIDGPIPRANLKT